MLTLPRQVLIRQRLASHALADPAREVTERLARLASEPWAGRKVAVGAGSRGIDRIAVVVGAVVAWLREQRAEPFIIPAMGSHGGGTPEGQRALLASYGITEATMGAPIRDEVTTRQLGETPSGIAVHASTVALDADAVLLINRVKPHTDFSSDTLGSGLRKMCGIGLGKVNGATTCHLAASRFGHERVIREVAAVVASKLPKLYGVGVVEDGTHHLAKVEALRGSEFETREPEMFSQAWAWMPSLPLPDVDVLVVDEIGKDISGCGMDTNIIGRGVDTAPMANRRANVRAIYARSLTPGSHGNAVGIGLADVVSSRLVSQMDPRASYTNALSAMTPATVRISINFPSDAECLQAVLRVAGVPPESATILKIRNTLALEHIVASEACLPVLADKAGVEPLGSPMDWPLDAAGNFDTSADLLSGVHAS